MSTLYREIELPSSKIILKMAVLFISQFDVNGSYGVRDYRNRDHRSFLRDYGVHRDDCR